MKLVYLFFFICSFALAQTTLEVGAGKPYKTIKQALEAAKDGDKVIVHKGIYKEGTVVIDKKIHFIGKDYPVIDGQEIDDVIAIKSSDVVVKGLKVINSGYATMKDPCAIKVYNENNVRIENNILDNNFFGIYIQNGTNCIVKNNKITAHSPKEQQSGNGIHAWKSENIEITNNEIIGHRDGIYFEFVYHSTISNNIAKNNLRYGLHFMFSHNDSYDSNTFTNNGAGVAVMYSRQVTMTQNTFNENWGDAAYGLLLKELTDSKIINNTFVHNTTGIYLEGTTRVKMEKNLFEGNGWAMKLQASCMDNEIINNNFLGNTFDTATNGSLTLNKFTANYWDKYEGYDLNKDGFGDVPYHPLSLFSVLVEKNPSAMLLFRSFMITLLDKSEKVLPSITPDNFKDEKPLMRPVRL